MPFVPMPFGVILEALGCSEVHCGESGESGEKAETNTEKHAFCVIGCCNHTLAEQVFCMMP